MVEITRNMVCKIIAVNAEFDICFCFILRLTDSWGEFEFEGSRHFLIPLLRLHLPAFEVGHRIQLLKVFFFHIFYYCWRFVQRWRLLVLRLTSPASRGSVESRDVAGRRADAAGPRVRTRATCADAGGRGDALGEAGEVSLS